MSNSGDVDLDVLACGLLRSQGLKHREIAEILGLKNTATVTKKIKTAVERGYLSNNRPIFHDNKLDEDQKGAVRRRVGVEPLRRKLDELSQVHSGRPGPGLRVFPSMGGTYAFDDWTRRLERFGDGAGPIVQSLLENRSVVRVGVTWGATVASVVWGMSQNRRPPQREACRDNSRDPRESLRCVPLCGEPLGRTPTTISATTLAGEVGRVLTGTRHAALSLGVVPAFLPGDFSAEELKVVRKLLSRVKDYQTALVGRDCDAVQLDAILCSVGPAEKPLGYKGNQLLEGLSPRKTESYSRAFSSVEGDVAGVLLRAEGVSGPHKRTLAKLESLWTGVRLEHLEKCAARAIVRGVPGIVLVAIGANKAQVVKNCVQRGLVGHLMIDGDLMRRLSDLLGVVQAAGWD